MVADDAAAARAGDRAKVVVEAGRMKRAIFAAIMTLAVLIGIALLDTASTPMPPPQESRKSLEG